MLQLPVTLTTATVLAMIAIGVAARAALTNSKRSTTVGEAKNLFAFQPSVPKFAEYLPALLLLMRLLEAAGTSRLLLAASSAALVLARVLHGIGMAQLAPHYCRAAGAIGTTILVVFCACYGLTLES